MKIISTIEARMNSTRLPVKVLEKIGANKSIELQYKRIKQSKLIDEVIIITSTSNSDDVILEFSKKNNILCFRGSEDDIVSRIYQAAKYRKADVIVQTTGDCPLVDAELIDKGLKIYFENSYDLVGNNLERTYPIGLDYRIFSYEVIQEVDKVCKDPIHRSHGSTFIYSDKGKKRFSSYNITADEEYSFPKMRLTVDTIEDLKFMKKISEIFPNLEILSSKEIISYLNKNKELTKINQNIRQKTIEEG